VASAMMLILVIAGPFTANSLRSCSHSP
jgi:hypothetical protein